MYLSDGGYSRLLIEMESVSTASVNLSDVSLQKVKDKWEEPEVQQAVRELEKIIGELMRKGAMQ